MPEDYRSRLPNELPPAPHADALISDHFRFGHLTHSETAERHAIDNDFEARSHLEAAIHLARNVLQPVRDAFGPFVPNSVYRSQALERALKHRPPEWISNSQHSRGEAADIEIPGLSTLELARWVERHLEYDQLICECHDPTQGPNSGWVHVSLAPPGSVNRRESLSYVMDLEAGEYVYVPELVESLA